MHVQKDEVNGSLLILAYFLMHASLTSVIVHTCRHVRPTLPYCSSVPRYSQCSVSASTTSAPRGSNTCNTCNTNKEERHWEPARHPAGQEEVQGGSQGLPPPEPPPRRRPCGGVHWPPLL